MRGRGACVREMGFPYYAVARVRKVFSAPCQLFRSVAFGGPPEQNVRPRNTHHLGGRKKKKRDHVVL